MYRLRWTGVLCAALLAVVSGAGVYAQKDKDETPKSLEKRIESQQSELERIKKKINEHRAQSNEWKKQESEVLSTLSNLEKEINLSQAFLRNLKQQESLMTERIDSLRVAISAEEGTLARQNARLAKRLRQMYKRDPHNRFNIVLGSENIQQAVQRYKFSKLIAEQDATLIEEVRYNKLSLERESAELTEALADIVVVRSSRQEEAQRLDRGKRRRETMLAQIRGEKSKREKAIKDLEKSQEELKNLIGNLEERRGELERQGLVTAGEFIKLKGQLIRPVEGRILRGFGKIKHPKFGTVTFNNGVDIGAPSGTPVRAVAPGLIEFVDWIDAYGKCIIINHGSGYYTLYAHVSTTFVSNGQQVKHGDVIAEVGDTGSLEGYECHFEIRKSKQALNPLEWFAQR